MISYVIALFEGPALHSFHIASFEVNIVISIALLAEVVALEVLYLHIDRPFDV